MGYTQPFLKVRYVGTDTVEIWTRNGTFPYIQFVDSAGILIQLPNTGTFTVCDNTTAQGRIYQDGTDFLLESMINNKDMHLKTTGSGVLKFGTYTAGAATDSTGYITIKDTAGNTRKLMVQA